MKKLKINVTEKDIEDGIEKDSHWCPIARAVRRIFPDQPITVGDDTVMIDDHHIYLTRRAMEFVHNFDTEGPVEPFAFCVLISEQLAKEIKAKN
jgi:hypothetical protein